MSIIRNDYRRTTAGGFRGDCSCALEPSSGYYDDIRTARENGTAYMLKKNEPMIFDLELILAEL